MKPTQVTPAEVLATLFGKPDKPTLERIRAALSTSDFQQFLQSFGVHFDHAADEGAINWKECILPPTKSDPASGAIRPLGNAATVGEKSRRYTPPVTILVLAKPVRWALTTTRSPHATDEQDVRHAYVWQLCDEQGNEWITLRGSAIEDAYGKPEQAVRLQLYALPSEAADQRTPQIQIEPPPQRSLGIVLHFLYLEGNVEMTAVRTLTIAAPLVPHFVLDQNTSSLGDPLPQTTFASDWHLSIEIVTLASNNLDSESKSTSHPD